MDLRVTVLNSAHKGLELELDFTERTDLRRTLAVQMSIQYRDASKPLHAYESVDLNSFGPLAPQMREVPLKVAFQVGLCSVCPV